MNKTFGDQIRKERKKRGLTVETVATACEVSRSYITLIENNKRLPGKKILPKIAAAFDIKPAVVLNWYLENIRQKIQKNL